MEEGGTLAYDASEKKGHKNKASSRVCVCNDVIFAILFLAYFVVMAVFSVAYGKEGLEDAFEAKEVVEDAFEDQLKNTTGSTAFFSTTLALSGIGIAIGVAWSLAMAFMAAWFINAALIFSIILCFTTGAVLSMELYDDWGDQTWFWLPGLAFGLMGIGLIIYMCMVQSRIAFASANLRVAAKGIISCWGVYVIAIGAAGVQILWFAMWLAATYGCATHYGLDASTTGLLFIPQLIGYFWGMFIIKGLVVVTVAGAISRWWSEPSDSSMRTIGALAQACTSNFGSVAFGSLFTAVLETFYVILRSIASSAARSGNCLLACLAGCCACMLKMVEEVVEYFNKWAFTYVGIENLGFCTAGSRVLRLFKDRGWDAIINDQLTGNVFLLGSFTSALLCYFAGYQFGKGDEFSSTENSQWILGSLGLLIGWATAHVIFAAMSGALNAVFVLFCEHPEVLRREHPEEFETLEAAWIKMYPDEYRAAEKDALNNA